MKHRIEHVLRGAAVLAVAAATWALACAPVLADTDPATQGFYAGGGVGRYDIRINNAADLGNTIDHYSATDTAYQFLAGWRFAPYLALEANYMNLGTNRRHFGPGTQLTNKIYGWAPWIVATVPLGPIEVFARGGEYWYRYHRDFITPGAEFVSASNAYRHFVWGVGVGGVVAKVLALRLEYDILNIQNTNNSNALWLTAAFRF